MTANDLNSASSFSILSKCVIAISIINRCHLPKLPLLIIFIYSMRIGVYIYIQILDNIAMIASLIKSIQKIISLSPEEIDVMQSLFKERIYKKGDFFLEEGRICKEVGFIVKGLMRYYISHDGEEKTYEFFPRKMNMYAIMKVFYPKNHLQRSSRL